MYVKVRVTAGARKEMVVRKGETEFEIVVREKAERNMANKRVQSILAEEFGVFPRDVAIVTGHRSGSKIFSIDNV